MDNLFRDLSHNSEITDIIICGTVDNEDDIFQFYFDFRVIYIEFESKYLRLESVEQYSKLEFSIVDHIKFDYEIDEDMYRARSSVKDIILDNSGAVGNSIREIVLYDRCERNICAAMEFRLENGQEIFIDPSFIFGINIGGDKLKNIWKNNYYNLNQMNKECITL